MAGHPACISRPDVSPLADAPRSNQSFGGDVEEVGKLGSARFDDLGFALARSRIVIEPDLDEVRNGLSCKILDRRMRINSEHEPGQSGVLRRQ